MKKQLVIALSLVLCSFSFAQKKEMKAAEKAIKGSNFAEAKAAINQAESFVNSLRNKKLKNEFSGSDSLQDIKLIDNSWKKKIYQLY